MTLPRVLFITDNGHGLGHLTRMMAVASHANGRFNPVFLTMSEAYPLVRQFQWPVEYLPSYRKLRIPRTEWEPIFATRLLDLLTHIRPRVLVVDHIFPSPVLELVRELTPGLVLVWSRRGMWRAGENAEAIDKSRYFDAIVEPRDVAAALDVGLTTDDLASVDFVNPIVLVQSHQQYDRIEARSALGLPRAGSAVLIQLSDSDPQKLANLIKRASDVISDEIGGVHLFSPLHALHRGSVPAVSGVTMAPVYPMSKYLNAFDGIVTTAGYNSFHEAVASGLPIVVVPRDTESLDDQRRRAQFVELSGRGFFADSVESPMFRAAVKKMLADDEVRIAQRVTEEMPTFNGGSQFAELLADLAENAPLEAIDANRDDARLQPSADMLQRLASGSVLDADRLGHADRLVISAVGIGQERFDRLVGRVATAQDILRNFKPFFLVDDLDKSALDGNGFQFESVMTRDKYEELGGYDYQAYTNRCLSGLAQRYQPSKLLVAESDSNLASFHPES